MLVYFLGSIGFIVYLLYDINSILWNNRFLQKGFLIGSIMVLAASILMVKESHVGLDSMNGRGILWLILVLVNLLALIYTLFFAIPFDETYIRENKVRLAYTEKVYALCRHPGVLWYAFLFLALSGLLHTKSSFFQAIFLIAWNVIYIIIQDLYTFPRTFSNYGEYKRTTPFLIPNLSSIRRCLQSYHT